jgi:hypothetical protein
MRGSLSIGSTQAVIGKNTNINVTTNGVIHQHKYYTTTIMGTNESIWTKSCHPHPHPHLHPHPFSSHLISHLIPFYSIPIFSSTACSIFCPTPLSVPFFPLLIPSPLLSGCSWSLDPGQEWRKKGTHPPTDRQTADGRQWQKTITNTKQMRGRGQGSGHV